NKFPIFIIMLTFLSSLIGMLILPNHFQLRFNLASGFHDASKWELFVVPFCSVIVYFLFIRIKSYYDNKNDYMRMNIAKWALYILPIIVLLVNINFMYEAYNPSIGSNNMVVITGSTVYIMNSILLIMIGLTLFIFINKKEIKIISIILCVFGLIGLILSLLVNVEVIAIVFLVLIILMVLSIAIYRIKFMEKDENQK
ncbi:MAG: hypothetical protein RSC10_06975, partial [Longicatena sp.]